MKARKEKVQFKGYCIQSSDQWITDGAILIFEKSFFCFGKMIDALVGAGQPFQLKEDGSLTFQFKAHDISRLEGDHIIYQDYVDSEVLLEEYGKVFRMFYRAGAEHDRLWVDNDYFKPFKNIVAKIEISQNKMMRLSAEIDNADKVIALIMCSNVMKEPRYLYMKRDAA